MILSLLGLNSERRWRKGLRGASGCALSFAHAPAFTLRGLLVIRIALHITNEAFFLTQFFEASNHLLHRFACTHNRSTHCQFRHSM